MIRAFFYLYERIELIVTYPALITEQDSCERRLNFSMAIFSTGRLTGLVVLLVSVAIMFKTAVSTEALSENQMSACLATFGDQSLSQRENTLNSAWMSLSPRERAEVLEVSAYHVTSRLFHH